MNIKCKIYCSAHEMDVSVLFKQWRCHDLNIEFDVKGTDNRTFGSAVDQYYGENFSDLSLTIYHH